MQSYSQDLRDRVLRALARGDGPVGDSRGALRSAASMSIRCGSGSKRPGYAPVFRSAADTSASTVARFGMQ